MKLYINTFRMLNWNKDILIKFIPIFNNIRNHINSHILIYIIKLKINAK